jgi:hypothetical protein
MTQDPGPWEKVSPLEEGESTSNSMALQGCIMQLEHAIERLRSQQESSFGQLQKRLSEISIIPQAKSSDDAVPLPFRESGSEPLPPRSIEPARGRGLSQGSWMTSQGSWMVTEEASPLPPTVPARASGNYFSAISERVSDMVAQATRSRESCRARPSGGPGEGDRMGATYSVCERSKRQLAKEKAAELSIQRDEDTKSYISGRRHVSDRLKFVRTPQFDQGVGFLLAWHAVFVGFQVQLLFSRQAPIWTEVLEFIFCLLFSVEVLLRMFAYGLHAFFLGEDKAWNVFDLVVVAVSQIYIAFTLISRDASVLGGVAVLRYMRFLRLTRVLRVIRMLRAFRHLRVLFQGLLSTLWTASSTLILLFIIIYIFAVLIAQSVAYHLLEEEGAAGSRDPVLTHHFGSLPKTFGCLFMSITGGIDWEDALIPLLRTTWLSVALFIIYISFVLLCVMNVVTGIFCESAIEAAQRDRDHMIDLQLQNRARFTAKLKQLFMQWDTSGDGAITIDEFEAHLSDDRMLALFDTLEVMASDAWTLFKLLDSDGEGTVSIDEFITGCIRLRGDAKAIHMEKLNYEVRWLMSEVAAIPQAMMAAMHPVPSKIPENKASPIVKAPQSDRLRPISALSGRSLAEERSLPYVPAAPSGAPPEVMLHPGTVEDLNQLDDPYDCTESTFIEETV